MSQSRIDFMEQYRVLTLASTNSATFDDPSNADIDSCAKLLRSALAVSIFSTIETFIRVRTAEVLAAIDHQRINFSSLPDGIQRAATFGAVRALNFRLQQTEKSQKQNFAVQQAAHIASTASTSYRISALSFCNEKSNIGTDDIDDILSCFQIDSGWNKIKIIASRVGFGGAASFEEIFRGIAVRRHLSAHTVNAQVTQSDLVDSLPFIYAIAISFDLMLSKCAQLIKDKDPSYLGTSTRRFTLDPNSLPFSKIVFSRGRWRFTSHGARTSRLSDIDRDVVFNTARTQCETRKVALVEFASNGQPSRWHC
jgi:hypothetical protein